MQKGSDTGLALTAKNLVTAIWDNFWRAFRALRFMWWPEYPSYAGGTPAVPEITFYRAFSVRWTSP